MKSTVSLVGKFFSLPAGEMWLALRASLLVLAVRVALRWWRLERVRSWVATKPGRPRPDRPDMAQVVKTVWILNRVSAALLPAGPCLSNALVTQRYLDRLGYSTSLRIGVRLDDTRMLHAHAWLERNNQIVTGWLPDLDEYRALPLE